MELTLDAANWRRRAGVARLLDALGAAEGLTRYVGGAVRDDLLGLDGQRYRSRHPAPARGGRSSGSSKARIKAVPTGIDHGTITAVSDGQPVEITTLRRDVSTDGRRATVAFTDDWQEDAARRDFTINALSADPRTGEIFDYFGGPRRSRGRRVRFIGDPAPAHRRGPFADPALLPLPCPLRRGRARRGCARRLHRRANDLMALSRERIADELLKLLGLPDPAPTVALMLDRGNLQARSCRRSRPVRCAALERLIAPSAPRRSRPTRSAGSPLAPARSRTVAERSRPGSSCRTRRASASPARPSRARSEPAGPAYRLGIECALDRLLLAGEPAERGIDCATGHRRACRSAAAS